MTVGALRRAIKAKHIYMNPGAADLRTMAKKEERTTIYGSASYVTKVRNRSAKNTYIVEGPVPLGVKQAPISRQRALEIADEVCRYLQGQELICLDRTMGQHNNVRLHCRLYITKDYARIPYMWHETLFEPEAAGEPDFISIYVPEWPERIIFFDPSEYITYILGTDYFGECKKSFLRMAMFWAKQHGWLGFHAGSKVLRVQNRHGIADVGFIMFGLSGTGKTTLTVHDHGLSYPEAAIIRQDDVVVMDEKGYCYGTEAGFFFKTEGLEPSQKVLYEGATRPDAILENVKVYENGVVDFLNYELTTNGRGVVRRAVVRNVDEEIDLNRADKIIFITRRKDIIPPVCKLNPEQAAAYFMLGESIETSAGDPTKAGQSKREVGTNPFIVGPEYEEGNRLLEILQANPDIECYLFNTGSVGGNETSEGEKITIQASTEIMKQIALGGITWEVDPDWGYLVAKDVPGVEWDKYDPRRYYSSREYEDRVAALRRERLQWLAQFPGLHPSIVKAISG